MLQLPFPARQPAAPLSPPSAALLLKRQAARIRKTAHRRFEGTLWRTASLGLVANLTFAPQRFSPSARAIGNAYKFRFFRPRTLGECLDLVLALLIWPVGMPLAALWFTARNGSVVRKRSGVSRGRQFVSQLRLVCTSGLMPPWYYIFELYRPGEMARARGYLTRAQTKHGSYALLAKSRGSTSPLGDKEAFARHCAERQLSALPVLLSAHSGELRGNIDLPATDLFLKPVHGRGGRGAERWDHIGHGAYKLNGAPALSSDQFLARLRDKSRSQPLLVQERARNHPAMRDLSNGALNTIRLLSCLDEQDQPEIMGAVLRIAVGSNVTVDNVHAGGLAAAIDLDEGRLMRATDLGADAQLGWTDRHPQTGARITGRVLPMWDEVRDLACQAHRAFNDRVVIGWDIAIMEDRPRLVEGNSGPDIDLVQRPLRTAFADGRFGELLAFHLKQCESSWRN
jgi:hypothetical protein